MDSQCRTMDNKQMKVYITLRDKSPRGRQNGCDHK